MRDYDIESDLKQEKFQNIKLVQGDRGNKIKINIYEDGQPVSLTGCSVTAKYKRADGKVVDGTVENKTDNYFYAVMNSNITKVAGTLKMLFSIEKDDVKVSTFLLFADVREGIGENTGSSGGDTEVTVDLEDYQKKMDNGLETKNKYIVGAINEVNSQCKDIANENTEIKNTMNIKTDNIQQQVNNLVLGAVGDGNNAEVVQARGDYNVLGERLNAIQNGSGINFENGTIIETLEETQVKTANKEYLSKWVPANAPFYYIDNSCFKEKYITKLTLKFNTIGSVFTLGFKNVNDYTNISANDTSMDGEFCTITSDSTDWTEYDLTNLDDTRISFVKENLTNNKIYINSGMIPAFGKNGENCSVCFCSKIIDGYEGNKFFISKNGAVAGASLSFDIKVGIITKAVIGVGEIQNSTLKKMNKRLNTLENILEENEFKNKNISILGDSISTFKGYIPNGNAVFFTGANGGITDVSMTWWYKLITNLEGNLCINNSWSGSRVTTTQGSSSAGCMARCENLHNENTNPDIIIIYMGINDFNNHVPIGTYNGTTSISSITDTNKFREAYAVMINKVLTKYTNAKVYVCTLPYCDRSTDENDFPELNANSVPLTQYNDAIRELAHAFGLDIIEMSKCGITFQNRKTFLFDELHPNVEGMKKLCDKAEKTIRYS